MHTALPAGQSLTHWPAEQTCASGHELPHFPQLSGSVWRFVQYEQSVSLVAHVGACCAVAQLQAITAHANAAATPRKALRVSTPEEGN